MAVFLAGRSARVSSSSLCRALPPEFAGVQRITESATGSEQGCNVLPARASASSRACCSSLASFDENGAEMEDVLNQGRDSPIGCQSPSSLFSELGTITSLQTDMDSKALSFSQTDTLPRTITSVGSVEDHAFSLPTWECFCVNIGILVIFAAADLTHMANFRDQSTGLCILIYVLYPVLVCVLLLLGVFGCWCSRCQCRMVWFLITALHAMVGLISGLWRELGPGAACTAGLLQFLAIALYPVDLLSVLLVSLALVPTFVAVELGRAAPMMMVVEGVLLLVAVGIGACVICMIVSFDTSATEAVAAGRTRAKSSVLWVPFILLERASAGSPRRSLLDLSASRRTSVDIQALFAPLFVGDSTVLTPLSGPLPEVTTRLDRLVSRLVAAKDNIERSSWDGELRRVLMVVLSFLLKELKDVSSLHTVPMEELACALPMTKEYVRKTLNQQADYLNEAQSQSLLAPSGTAADATANALSKTQLHPMSSPGNKDRKPISFQKFAEEQSKASRTSSEESLARVSTKDTEIQNSTEASTLKRDFRNMFWKGTPDTPATFDQAVSAMMTCLTFCEYIDELPPPRMSPELAATLTKDLGTWSFDVFKLSRLCESRPLVVAGESALRHLVDQMGLQAQQVTNFLDAIEARYHSTNTYHNQMHAADVVNSCFYFLCLRSVRLEGLDLLEQLSCLVAAAAHDVGHDSKANRYHVAAKTPLAVLFNDQSVLENMHCALTFAVLHGESANFLAVFDEPQCNAFRSLVLHLILDTDLARHIQVVSRFRQEFVNKGVGEEYGHDAKQPAAKPSLTASQRKELLSFLLKSADVSGSTKPFDLHVQWTMRINTEFFEQGDAERDLGLPCSPFCDRQGTNLAESQCGFFDFIVAPLYTALDEYLASRRLRFEVLPEMERNRAFWKRYDGLTFDYSNPMSNGDILRRLYVAGLALTSDTQKFSEDNDDKAGAFQKTPSEAAVPTPTLLSTMALTSCKHRLSSKESTLPDGNMHLYTMKASGPSPSILRQAQRGANQT